MEELERVVLPSPAGPDQETPVLKEQVVEEILARLRQGASVQGLAAEYGVDRKTIRAWRGKGGYVPRQPRERGLILDAHRDWLTARAPEVEFNAAVLYRELCERGYSGSSQQVLRFVRPLRVAARQRTATVRYETAPGQQAQVDFGQRRLWIGDACVPAHVFVFTLGYSRRLFARAFTHERLDAVLQGHEQAFRHFGGVPEHVVVDNAKSVILRHDRTEVIWHPSSLDFAHFYGFRPWAHWPYRPQTKGKVESNVKYVKRNALAGKRFGSWDQLNEWLLEWATTVADLRVHGTTHEVPRTRFTQGEQDQLRPLGDRPLYARERVSHRVVPSDALVAIGGSRYSVPVQYVGETVTIRELLGSYEILHQGTVIARHAQLGRHRVAMERQHYAGLLRPRAVPSGPEPPAPRYDPRYPATATVAVRDLAVYAALVEPPVVPPAEEHRP